MREKLLKIITSSETIYEKCVKIERMIRLHVLKERGRCYMIARKSSSRLRIAKTNCSPCDIAREIIGDDKEEAQDATHTLSKV